MSYSFRLFNLIHKYVINTMVNEVIILSILIIHMMIKSMSLNIGYT